MARQSASLVLIFLGCGCLANVLATTPPKIISHPPLEIAYKMGEKVDLPCEANGDPAPTYKWTKNNVEIKLGSDMELNGGMLSIEYPNPKHEGIYQCVATNNYGVAVSIRTNLKLAVMDPFATLVGEPPVHEPVIGSSLTLTCNPPKSYPKGIIYWALTDQPSSGDKTITRTDSFFSQIKTDARVASDYDGSLWFANVEAGDDKVDQLYSCMLYNPKLRGYVQGDDQRLKPKPAPSGSPTPSPTKLVWNSHTPNIVLIEGTAYMKCIFSGYPTPKVTWERVGGAMPSKAYSPRNSGGLELVIPSVQYEDAGTYRCKGTNDKTPTPVTKDIILDVQSEPNFNNPPDDVSPLEGEDAEFQCTAGGKPQPTITWSFNGRPLSDLEPDSRRTVSSDQTTIHIKGVLAADTMVLQCNASNPHGYAFSNAILNVIAETPSIVEPPQLEVRVVEGRDISFACRAKGAPRPRLSWLFKDSMTPVAASSRCDIVTNGVSTSISIKSVTLDDAGEYYCFAVNKYGEAKVAGQLVVREKTTITTPPSDQSVTKGQTATFPIGIHVDPEEKQHLKVKWFKDDQEIVMGPKYSMGDDHSLIIHDSAVADTGNYKCKVDTELDSIEASAKLVVKDRPEAPQNVKISCQASEIEITWTPGFDNNDPVEEFIVYYESSALPGVTQEGPHVPAGEPAVATLDVIPWVTYTIYVMAENSIGRSVSSTTSQCKTLAAVPSKHPENVCVECKEASQLVITWTPMNEIDQYGEGFHYVVSYKPRDQPDAKEIKVKVEGLGSNRLVVENQPTMTEYIIYVQAANTMGVGDAAPKKIIGFSGEGKPLDKPDKVWVDESSLNATSVILQWSPVDTSPARVKGYFRGYRVSYWPQSSPDQVTSIDIKLGDATLCRPLDDAKRRRRRRRAADENAVSAQLTDLKPYTTYSASVSVLNLGHSGELSDPYVFKTDESTPGPVSSVHLADTASHNLVVEWKPPAEANGEIVKYVVTYEPADDTSDDTKPIQKEIEDPSENRVKLTGLTPDTEYIISVSACTSKGCGEAGVLTGGKTVANIPPDAPIFSSIVTGDNSMNVSWAPYAGTTPKNPGESFYVRYRKKGADNWEKESPVTDDQHWVNVTGLEKGVQYEVQVVAVNGGGVETGSDIRVITVGPEKEEVIATASADASWLIILLAIILLLIIIILIILFIRYNRGQKYAVEEKERLHGHRPDEPEEEGFGEYAKPRAAPVMGGASNGPVATEVGAPESDEEDDLDIYDQMDATKFNEDGSFIGQYGGKKKGYDVEDPQKTHALSTFV